jgi:hypothetical protein
MWCCLPRAQQLQQLLHWLWLLPHQPCCLGSHLLLSGVLLVVVHAAAARPRHPPPQ